MRPRECHHGLVTRWLIRIVGGPAPRSAGAAGPVARHPAISHVRKSSLGRRASISAPGAASPERGFAIRPSRIATKLAETRKAVRIKCRIMTLERGRPINFPQTRAPNRRGSSPRQAPQARGRPQPGAQLFRPRADCRRPDFRTDWNKQQDDCEAAEPGDHDPDECRVAIDLMTLHKEGTAQQSIIQYARLWGAFGTARLPMLGASSTLFVLHQHSLC
jgi:hypothetical protein